MPRDEITIRPGVIYEASDYLDGWVISPPIYNVGETVTIRPQPITLSSIENMLGMNSTVDIIRNIKSYIISNLSSINEDTKSEAESKIDRIIEALGRDNYMPTRRVYRTPPTHTVYLEDKSVEQFLKKLSNCRYINWR